MKRRSFIAAVPAATALMTTRLMAGENKTEKKRDKWGDLLPQRTLGATGERVTLLGVGGFHVGWTEEKDAAEVIEAAMEGGIRFFDNAESYGKGESEIRYGKYLTPKYREDIFLMTKTAARDAKTFWEHLEGSLSRMKTDYIDLYQIHNIADPEDVDYRIENGVLDALVKAQEQGKVRHVGFTGHRNPEAHLRMLEHTKSANPFATCQLPINALDPHSNSFQEQVLPILLERNIAPLGMKSLADGRFFALKRNLQRIQWQSEKPIIPTELSIRDAIHYVWSLPVSTLITGAENASLLREKIDFAKTFATPFSEQQLAAILEKTRSYAEGEKKVEYYKRPIG